MTDIRELLEDIPIEEILERQGVDYRVTHGSSGEQLNVKECPFCGGSSWKVYLNRDSGLGNCFHGSCGERFNSFKFVKQLVGARNSLDLKALLQTIALELGWQPPRKAAELPVVEQEWQLPDCSQLPLSDGRMPVYLTNRGVTPEIAKAFDLRWSARGWFNYIKADGSKSGQFYGSRIIIPVYDLDGSLVTFQGRDASGKAERKYLFPPGLPGSGAFLYNGHRGKGKKKAVLVEGAFDVIGAETALRAFAIDDAVLGSFGKHLSRGHDESQESRFLRLKRLGLEEVRVMWDGEKAAFEAAINAATLLNGLGIKSFVCTLPAGKDPGEASARDILAAYNGAQRITPLAAIKLRLSNPYAT